MPDAYVVHWYPPELAERVAWVEDSAKVVGSEARSVSDAVQEIQAEDPDVVVAFVNKDPNRTRGLLLRLRTVAKEDRPPVILVDGSQGAREMLEPVADGAYFTRSDDLGDAIGEAT